MKKKGLFITFEGGEGAGKSTQIQKAAALLKKKGKKVLLLREPGGTEVSEAIREVILSTRHKKLTPETELLLYLAARAQIVREKIQPALEKGICVLCDRFEDSTLAYQGYGRGLSLDWIYKLSLFVRGKQVPDLTILLDIDPEKGLARGGRNDRMEKESLSFHQKIRKGFLAIAKKNRKRFLVVDSSRGPEEVFKMIEKKISKRV